MIEVKGPNVFSGYWRQPDKTRAEFRDDGYFMTGDLGRIDARGYVFILGRSKDLGISGGYNIYPKEIEAEIDALPGVIESAVIGLPHPDFGEGVKGVKFADIREGSPAAKAGLKAGDVLVEFDGKPIQNLYDFTYALRAKKPGDEVMVKVVRGSEAVVVKVLLTKRK